MTDDLFPPVVVPPPPSAARCTACNAPIRFARTAATGKPMPLDWAPDRSGNVVVRGNVALVLTGRQALGRDPAPAGTRYMPHFATCTARQQPPVLPANVADLAARRKDLQ